MKASVTQEVVVLGEKLERWDKITFKDVVNVLRRAGKCKFTKFGEDRDEKEVFRVSSTLPSAVNDTELVDVDGAVQELENMTE